MENTENRIKDPNEQWDAREKKISQLRNEIQKDRKGRIGRLLKRLHVALQGGEDAARKNENLKRMEQEQRDDKKAAIAERMRAERDNKRYDFSKAAHEAGLQEFGLKISGISEEYDKQYLRQKDEVRLAEVDAEMARLEEIKSHYSEKEKKIAAERAEIVARLRPNIATEERVRDVLKPKKFEEVKEAA